MSRSYVDNDVFMFATDLYAGEGYRTTIAVHWSAFSFEASASHLTAIDRFLSKRPEVAEAWFVFPEDLASVFESLSRLDEFKNRAMHQRLVHYRLFAVADNGEWNEISIGEPPAGYQALELTEEIVSEVQADGMRQIFRDTGSLSPASAGFHYERPGRGHSEVFMRTSQSVARSQHCYFIAAKLLAIMTPTSNTRLFADTSGIIPLLSAVKDLWIRLSVGVTNVAVDTFGGYDGFEKNLKVTPERHWVVISSSSSGTLAQSIINQKLADVDSVITVYYLSWVEPQADAGFVICDLSNRTTPYVESVRDARLRPHNSYRVSAEGVCEFCEQGSHPIELVGDSFFPAPTDLRLRMPSVLDRPYAGARDRAKQFVLHFDHQDYFEDFFGIGAIVGPENASQRPSTSTTALQYGVSTKLSHLLGNRDFKSSAVQKKIEAAIRKVVPSRQAVAAVVSLQDIESSTLAKFVANWLWGDEAVRVGVSSWKQSGEPGNLSAIESVSDVQGGKTVLAVAGIIGSGRALLSLNRDLRVLPDAVRTAYLVGVAHPESDNAMSIFKSSLGIRSTGSASEFEICWMLPRDPRGPGARNAWLDELAVLERVEAWLSRYGYREERRALRARTSSLQRLPEDQLFIAPDFDEGVRSGVGRINPKFALWPFEWADHPRAKKYGAEPTQAEVFATVAHLLYESRRSNPTLSAHAHGVRRHGYAINPAIFDRLNDPQLQSAVLRAAEPGELDYHADHDASRAASEILKHILQNVDRQGGQAAYEFLFSITRGLQDRRGPGLQIQREMLLESIRLAGLSRGGLNSFPPLCRALLYYVTDTRPEAD